MQLISELRQIDKDYGERTIEIANGLNFSQYQKLREIEFYSNSEFLNGNLDSTGREKPFYNIVNTMVDTAVVATDIDTKDIRVEAEEESSYAKSFLFNHELKNWMEEANFAKTLNDMGEIRARYGGVIIKKTEDEDGDLVIDTVQWKNITTDPVDIKKGLIVEKHYMTPGEVRAKSGVWSNTEEAIDLYAKKGYTRVDERIEIWEVEGELPESYLSDDEEATEDDDYTRQHHFYAVKGAKTAHLFWEEQKDSAYKYLPWKVVSGRGLGKGVVEEGIEAQVWSNDAMQKEQSAMELSGKVLLKTDSKKVGQNVMTDLENGSIIELDKGQDIDVLNLLTGALPQFENMVGKWWNQFERVTASYGAIRGETPPSGQPYRLQALVSQAGASHFDYRREEWGIFLKEVIQDWVFPYIQKKLTTEHILASEFSPEEIIKIDEAFSKNEANKRMIEATLNGTVVTIEDYATVHQQVTEKLATTGSRRFFKIPKGWYKDIKAQLTINITGEQKNKMAALETLSSVLQTIVPLVQQGMFAPDDIKTVINKILETSGTEMSPLSLSNGGGQQQGQPQGQPSATQEQPQPLGGRELKALQPQANQ